MRRFCALILVVIVLAGCGTATSAPTAVSLPPTTQIMVTTTPPTVQSEQVWKQEPVGTSALTITFYGDPGGTACLRLQLNIANSAPVEKCATANNLVAVQSTETAADGKMYTIVAGRTLTDKITAVSLELSSGDNIPAEVDNGGFIVVLPGQQRATRAIPIDQYGNLVGQIFAFG